MSAGPFSRRVVLPARAKLNLDLAVMGRRSDGMHELKTHMQAISLHDMLEAEPAAETTLSVSGVPVAGTAAGNTVLSALRELEKEAGRALPTRFVLHKRIPPGSGLGGASSDAAAALRAAASIHGLEVDLQQVAEQIGADVSFFLVGGSALVEGMGEKVTRSGAIAAGGGWFAIAWPGIELSTAAVYRAWDETGGEGPNQLRRAAARVEPAIDGFALALGEGWQMTGSGSAFFKPCPDKGAARAAVAGMECWTAVECAVGGWA